VVCEHQINYTKSHGKNRVEEHVKSQKHIKNKELKNGKPKQTLIGASFQIAEQQNQNQFNIEMAEVFAAANIPIDKVNDPIFKNWLGKYMKRSISSDIRLRRCLPTIYDKSIEINKEKVSDDPVCFIIDETTDSKEKYEFSRV
jgi:hypothetical protein